MLYGFRRDLLPAGVRLLICGTVMIVALAGLADGQSGRKPPKPQPPTVNSTPDDQGGPAKPDNPGKPKTPITVTSYLPNTASSSIYTNVVVDGCLERLKQSGAFAVTREREMNRK